MSKNIHITLADAERAARSIAKTLRGGEILALIGPLGSGKTTFTKALAKELKVKTAVTSPTFVIMNHYTGKTKSGNMVHLYHLDLYRTKNFREVKALGLTDIWQIPNTITVIEWADKIKRHLPPSTQQIIFSHSV